MARGAGRVAQGVGAAAASRPLRRRLPQPGDDGGARPSLPGRWWRKGGASTVVGGLLPDHRPLVLGPHEQPLHALPRPRAPAAPARGAAAPPPWRPPPNPRLATRAAARTSWAGAALARGSEAIPDLQRRLQANDARRGQIRLQVGSRPNISLATSRSIFLRW